MPLSRRQLLHGSAFATLAAGWPGLTRSLPAATAAAAGNGASDEDFWATVRRDYELRDGLINLEAGNWGIMSRPVLERYIEHSRRVNRDNSFYARRQYPRDVGAVLERLAAGLAVDPAELALTRNATEALQALIGGYRGLRVGDAVMYADLDYGSIQAAMDALAQREQCSVQRLALPEPASHDGLVAFYRQALRDNPRVRLLLLTQVSHRTGLVLPVREIVAEARELGVDVIVDAAHAWGQLDYQVPDLGADFVGFNLHKWIGAPLGVGLLYIRRERLEAIAPHPAAAGWELERAAGRVHTGTSNFAAVLSVADALDYHQAIGPARKEARLRYLRSVWVDALQGLDGVTVLTPDDPRLHAGMSAFRLAGYSGAAGNRALAERLLEDFGIFTVHRDGVAGGACVRVTPALYNAPADCRALAAAVRALLGSTA